MQHAPRITGALLVESLSDAEQERARRVEQVLPALRAQAERVDRDAEFHLPHLPTLSEAGLLGLIVPTEYGGLPGRGYFACQVRPHAPYTMPERTAWNPRARSRPDRVHRRRVVV